MKIVLCLNHREFLTWCRRNDVPPSQAIYADSVEKVLGLEVKQEDIVDLGGAPYEVKIALQSRIR
jgi:hypothetical protein